MERRNFIVATAGAGIAAGANAATSMNTATDANAAPDPNQINPPLDPRQLLRVTDPGEMRGEMLYRDLGDTGEKVSALGLGGSHIGKPPVDEPMAIRLIQAAIDRGLTFMDNSWDYNDGQSELRMGKALAQSGYRKKAFVMTKLDGSHQRGRHRPVERVVEAPAYRPRRPDPAPRSDPLRRPRPHLLEGRIDGGTARGEKRPARSATSVSPVIRIHASTSTCSPKRRNTAFISTRCRCRST